MSSPVLLVETQTCHDTQYTANDQDIMGFQGCLKNFRLHLTSLVMTEISENSPNLVQNKKIYQKTSSQIEAESFLISNNNC